MKTKSLEKDLIKLKFKIFIFSIIFILVSCNKESDNNPNKALSGKWDWMQSTGGFAGQTYTPQSTGETVAIEFDNDSIFRQYINGNLDFETTYELKKVEGYSELFIFYKNENSASIISTLENNTLILLDYGVDGYERTYRKE